MLRAEDSRVANAQHGLARALLNNMVVGVDSGFTRTLQVRPGVERAGQQGVGAGRGGSPPACFMAHFGNAVGAGQPHTASLRVPACCCLTPHSLLTHATSLQMIGVGYKAAVNGSNLTLNLGYSHPIEMAVPQGLSVSRAAGLLCGAAEWQTVLPSE